ncbi:MAG TPA: hypothetical protein V6C76_15150 [Drouetiella sp.]
MPPGSAEQPNFADVESAIFKDLKLNPVDMQSVFKELMQLKQSETGDAFQKDLLQLNQDLHKQHLLPYFEIIEPNPNDPNGFDLKNLNTGETSSGQPPPMEQTPPSGDFNGSGSGPSGGGGGSDGAGDGGDGNGSVNSGGGGCTTGGGSGDVSAISDPGGDAWDGRSQGDMELSDLSAQYLGRQLWADTKWAGACDGGNEGCAASVSKVLQDAGINYAQSAGVLELAGQLCSNGWTESEGTNTAQPGDVIYGNNGGEDQHIGIVGLDRGQLVLYNNWSKDGRWHEEPLLSSYIATHFGSNVRVLHPAPSLVTAKTAATPNVADATQNAKR